jgi:hypothetical protein
MSINKATDARLLVGALVFTSTANSITGVLKGTVSVTPTTTLASNTKSAVAVTITGASAGDIVYLEPNASLEAGLVVQGYAVSAANTVTIQFYNPTASTGPATSARNWSYTVLKTS